MDDLVSMLRHVLGRHNDDGVPVVELVRRLVEGYDLMTEAVEQLENSLYLRGDDEYVCPDPECRRPPKEGHDAYCKLGPALAHLRGVGRD